MYHLSEEIPRAGIFSCFLIDERTVFLVKRIAFSGDLRLPRRDLLRADIVPAAGEKLLRKSRVFFLEGG